MPSQSVEPQHWVLVVQVVPTPWQQVRVVGDASQRSPAQHSVAAVQPIASPAIRQVVMGRRHVPLWQVVPVQHSALSTHAEPSAWQRQRPAAVSQRMYPQHCAELVHEPPCPWQHTRLVGARLHTKSPQQSLVIVQVVPPARHEVQRPPWHCRTPAHALPAQHA